MRWNWLRRASLRVRLLALLWPAMALVVVASLWFARSDAIASANAAYDRSLLGAIRALDLNVATTSGGLSVELPYRLFEFFQLTATGNVYFRVATADHLVEIGNPDLPPPPSKQEIGQPQFYNAQYFGEAVRVGAYMRALELPLGSSHSDRLIIQVAESTASREQFTTNFVRTAAIRDLFLLLIMSVAVLVGLTIALQPVATLTRQTQARAAEDHSPLDVSHIPRDIRPLVDAINQQLLRTELLAMKRRGLIDDASHQLRTPLAVLRAQLDFALRESSPEQLQSVLRSLSGELDQAIRTTNQLLVLARQDAARPKRQDFDLGELVRNVALELLPLARSRHVDLGVEAPDVQLLAKGDVEMLHQALVNLTHNAIEHGLIEGIVTLTASVDADNFFLRVTDNGADFDPEVLSRLGQRFAKSQGSRGSGLGLAIARTAIEHHGGTLLVEKTSDELSKSVVMKWPKQ